MSLDFFYNVSYETFASKMCERQVNMIMPWAKVFKNTKNFYIDKVDGGIDVDGNKLTHPCLTHQTAFDFIQAIDKAIRESKSDYMMILEPDVFVSKQPTTYPKESGGIIRNQLSVDEKKRIEDYLGHSITPYYSMAGGSVISTSRWIEMSKPIDLNMIESWFNIWPDSMAGDALLSMVLWYFEIHIEDWDELYESHMGDRKYSASIFHGIKTWYNYA